MKWIPVSEGLPEHGLNVITSVGCVVRVGWYSKNNRGWYSQDDDEEYKEIQVTHWQPLPEPPEDK